MKSTKATHGGKRIPGPGKKLGPAPSPFPHFLKKLRATHEERKDFASLLTGDARKDFVILLELLRSQKFCKCENTILDKDFVCHHCGLPHKQATELYKNHL